jgi:DNA polymerase III epsilon subunit-like protein
MAKKVKKKAPPKKKPVHKSVTRSKKGVDSPPSISRPAEQFLATLFDTETTGLIDNHTIKLDKQPHVIEFYAGVFDLKSGKLEGEYDTLIKPPVVISDEITKITGITNEMVVGKQSFSHHASAIFSFLTRGKINIAHNMSFDQEMIDIEAERLGHVVKWPRNICTVEQTVHLKSHRLTMTALHEHLFGEKFEGSHRARVDVQALARCCVELHRRRVI